MLTKPDSPYLAPVPYRGKTNSPAYVPFVAQQIASTRGISAEAWPRPPAATFSDLFQGAQA